MSHAAAIHVPAETDWLCEGCGYTLNGLPAGGNCPECGMPTCESSAALRQPPLWERTDAGPAFSRFWRTTAQIIFRPGRFYRSFVTRNASSASTRFAQIHRAIVSLLLGAGAWAHWDWCLSVGVNPMFRREGFFEVFAVIALAGGIYVSLAGITRLAARLTSWEAGYRGMRLPKDVVLRGLDYHAAHYLPVAMIVAATTLGYHWSLPHFAAMTDLGMIYLYTLCGEVLLAAAYLFLTYWIAMRNMMYASY